MAHICRVLECEQPRTCLLLVFPYLHNFFSCFIVIDHWGSCFDFYRRCSGDGIFRVQQTTNTPYQIAADLVHGIAGSSTQGCHSCRFKPIRRLRCYAFDSAVGINLVAMQCMGRRGVPEVRDCGAVSAIAATWWDFRWKRSLCNHAKLEFGNWKFKGKMHWIFEILRYSMIMMPRWRLGNGKITHRLFTRPKRRQWLCCSPLMSVSPKDMVLCYDVLPHNNQVQILPYVCGRRHWTVFSALRARFVALARWAPCFIKPSWLAVFQGAKAGVLLQ